MTVAQLLAQAARELRDARTVSPEWDAERLLRHVLGWDRATLVASPEDIPQPGARGGVPPARSASARGGFRSST